MLKSRIVSVLAAIVAVAFLVTPSAQAAPLTDATKVSFTDSSGVTSTYHRYAAGLDWTKPVGLLVYTDGSGEYGLVNPSSTYLLGGTAGLRAVARKHNLLLITPRAPGNGCTDGDGVCWYLPSYNGRTVKQKTTWSRNLVAYVQSQYPVDTGRVVFAGYSSGAQWLTEYFVPSYGDDFQADGVNVAISYGGQPINTPSFTASYKRDVAMVWDVGSGDRAYRDHGRYDAQSGFDWYKANGFTTTELNVVPGEDHSRSGQFGGVVDREITQHVRPAI